MRKAIDERSIRQPKGRIRSAAIGVAAIAMFVAAITLPWHTGHALADDAAPNPSSVIDASTPIDQQYAAVGAARTAADLAIRQAHNFFDDNEPNWRDASQGTDSAHGQIDDALIHGQDMENRKPDDQRSQATLDNLNAQRTQLAVDWAKFSNVTRANMEQSYRRDQNLINEMVQVFNNMTTSETGWKDLQLSMPATQALYQSIAQRAGALQADAAKQLSDLQAARKSWDAQFDAISKADDGK
jgi:hypothetical protein